MIFHNQLQTFKRILSEYNGSIPLYKFLPDFFRENRQMGSRDRKLASHLIYSYFRIGKALQNLPIEDRLFAALFLCSDTPAPFLNFFEKEYDERVSLPIEEKLAYLSSVCSAFSLSDVFPFAEELSGGFDKEQFIRSLFQQPELFIRCKPQYVDRVMAILKDHNSRFEEAAQAPYAFSLPNTTNLKNIFNDEQLKWLEVQDLSSQLTGNHFQPGKDEHWWDCCAASGGKSLLLHSREPSVNLFCTDIRESILNNLHARFADAGIKSYKATLLDLAKKTPPVEPESFDGIILDAPCSGSGTWGRSPEMISYFNEVKVTGFQSLQKKIASTVIPFLKPGKPLIYITCSAFKKENEEVVNALMDEHALEPEKMEVLKGYEYKADTMFVARLIRKK